MATTELNDHQKKFLRIVKSETTVRKLGMHSNPDTQFIVEMTKKIVGETLKKFTYESILSLSSHQQKEKTVTTIQALALSARTYAKKFEAVSQSITPFLSPTGRKIKKTVIPKLLEDVAPFFTQSGIELAKNRITLLKLALVAQTAYEWRCRRKPSHDIDYDPYEEPDLDELGWMLTFHTESLIICQFARQLTLNPPYSLSDKMVMDGFLQIETTAKAILLKAFDIVIDETKSITHLTKEEILQNVG